MKKIGREIYELGEIERDAARAAEFAHHGGLFYRIFKWLERLAREAREDRISARHDERER